MHYLYTLSWQKMVASPIAMTPKRFSNYELYERSVQDAPALCDFLENVYRDVTRKEPKSLAEDFSGSFSISREWVLRGKNRYAFAIDVDTNPLEVGKKLGALSLIEEDWKRLKTLKKDVLKVKHPSVDLICALNFSYGVIDEREKLKSYFDGVRRRLNPRGLFIIDTLGGFEHNGETETSTQYPGFNYVWEQIAFNPLTRKAQFQIHFEVEGEKKRRSRAFTYDWRMWSVPELKDLLHESGFRKVLLFWEGTGQIDDKHTIPDPQSAWVAYVVAQR